MNPFIPTCCNRLYSDVSLNHDDSMAYCECHIGSTFVGSVRRNLFNAINDIHCVVPYGAITFVLGSASKEYKQLLGSSYVDTVHSQSILVGGFDPSGVDTDDNVGIVCNPRDDNISVRYVERS